MKSRKSRLYLGGVLFRIDAVSASFSLQKKLEVLVLRADYSENLIQFNLFVTVLLIGSNWKTVL